MDEHGIDSSNDGQDGVGDVPEENLNISDVIEIIQTDPDFNPTPSVTRGMFSGGSHMTMPSTSVASSSGPNMRSKNMPEVKIIEQPAAKALRFRYECEGRSAGSIPGENSTPENKTFPSIRIDGYKGRAVVVVSCVTKDPPYRPHPHNLVGRDGCKRGVCTLEVSPETMSVTFSNLGIQCVKKKDIESALRVREEIRVDPFRTGFSHRNTPTAIDLNAVRLCFQVFIEGREKNKFTVPLSPVVSVPIYDKKAMSELSIIKLSDCVSTVDGGRKDIILLCEKVAKEDIQVRFYEEKNGEVVWEGLGDFQPSQVHKQSAIWFRAPRYKTLDVTEPVKVFIQLKRPSDGQTSDPLPFEFLPLDSDSRTYNTKKRKMNNYEVDDKTQSVFQQLQQDNLQTYMMNIPINNVKTEPREVTSPYLAQGYGGLSPMYVQNPAVSPTVVDSLMQPPQQPMEYSLPSNIDYNISPNNLRQTLPSISAINSSKAWNMSQVPFTGDSLNIASSSGLNIISGMNTGLNSISVMNTIGGINSNLQGINIQSGQTGMNIDTSAGLLLDLDTNQFEEIKSDDLREALNLPDATNNLSENFSMNLSLSDLNIPNPDNNMTDSLTRLANNTIDNIVKLNDMYKPDN